MHIAPADRRRTITLAALPPGAIFTCPGTRWRGLLLSWHRSRTGQRRECSVLLLHARGDDSPALRKSLRASLSVEIESRHDVVNRSSRAFTEAGAFAHLNEAETGRKIEGHRAQHELDRLDEAEQDAPPSAAPASADDSPPVYLELAA
jgi:hypothetical protein